MVINVRIFAGLRERIGACALQLELPAGARVSDARDLLTAMYPSVAPLLARSAFAIDQEYSSLTSTLREGSELAAIPPVSGG